MSKTNPVSIPKIDTLPVLVCDNASILKIRLLYLEATWNLTG